MRAGSQYLLFGDGRKRWVPAHKVQEAKERFGAVDVPRTSFGRVMGPMQGAQRALDALPTIGGIGGQVAGGAIGSPATALGPAGVLIPATMSVAGAGIGGGLGQGGRELGYRALGMGDAPGTIGGESQRQAQGAVLGEMMGLGVQAAARPLMRHGMGNPRPTPGQPDVVETNLGEVRAPTGKTVGRPGSAKATAAREASSQTLDRHADELAQAGHKVDGTAAIDRAYKKLSNEMQADATGAGQKQLDDMYNETIARHGKDLDPRMANTLRRRWDRASQPVLKAIDRAKRGGPLPDPTSSATAQWDKALADAMRGEIETTSGRSMGVGPEASPARAINRVTSRRIGVEQAIKGVEGAKRTVNPIVTGMGGVGAGLAGGLGTHSAVGGGLSGAGGMLAAHFLTQPETTSRLALWGTDPLTQLLLRLSPRFALGGPQK